MKSNKDNIELKEVSKEDFTLLYELLKKRDPIANISHKKMPTFEEHVKFVKSKPYHIWYIIYCKQEKVGSIYLSKQNEIGIFLKNDLQRKGIGMKALQLLIKYNSRKRYLANIHPKNKKSAEFFTKQGFHLIQHTFELLK